MNEFTATLAAFLAGRSTFAELEAAARAVAAGGGSVAPALAEVDRLARAARLPPQLHAALRRALGAAGAEPSADDDRTRLRPVSARPPSAPAARAAEPNDDRSAPSTGPPSTGGGSWSDPASWGDQPAQDIGPGSVLKGRFVLERIVGRGGMGVVFRAKDLRKEEAQDRDPFVAIKILNDDFRRHPESLKALQREARKAQTLAHPNIATVFDFDRDGSIVYIQMEFLDGDSLDKLAKSQHANGLPYAEAYPLIAGLGRALSYAHGKGIVHSDFKPGNCFLTANNVVKVFDFGIARAAHLPGVQASDLTRFDPGTLGALTPAYASCEMIEGETPDPRDDIYALGCVAYELLTGRHPFDKRPATEARDAGLAPAPVKGLSQRQFRALQKALAFRREERSASVAQFLEELGERKQNKAVAVSAAAAAVALAVTGFAFLPGFLQQRQVDRLVAAFGSSTEAQIGTAIEEYRALPPALQNTVLQAARDPLLEYFRGRVEAAVNPSQARYDYPAAEAVLATAESLIPDSATLSELAAALANDKAELLLRMRTLFDEHLAAGRLLPAEGPDDDVLDVLRVVAQASPGDSLLQDSQLVLAYTTHAAAALEGEDFAAARALLEQGFVHAPGDARLLDLQDTLNAALEARESAARLAALRAAPRDAELTVAEQRELLDALLAEPRLDAEWETRTQEILAALEQAAPGNPAVQQARERIGGLYLARATEMRGAARLAEAERLLAIAARFAPTQDALAREQTALAEARQSAAAADAARLRAAQLEGMRQTFLAAANANDLPRARATLASLRSELPATDPFVTATALRELGGVLARLAGAALAAGRIDEAEQLATEGLEEAPGTAALQTLLTEVRAARAAAERPVGQPCTESLAGFGSRGARGQCWDMLDADTQGPRLVVVPAGGAIAAPFAIGRFEIALAQWNAYCRLSEECAARDGEETLPLTQISIDEARRYAAWLGARTGATYRLPTAAEWEHAAAAPREGRNDDNCVVTAAGRGGAPRNVTQGQQNAWGLLNYQGNVQEWIESADSLAARGGTYQDSLDACTYTLDKRHTGAADAVTGFRLVREL